MTNEELKTIREDKKHSKGDFAKLLGITPMLLGRYESGKIQIPEEIEKKVKELPDTVVATEIEVKKTARKAGRKVKEAAEAAITAVKDQAAATEIEIKKTARKGSRKAKETASKAADALKESAKKTAGIPTIIIQSPMGGYITSDDIAKKVPKNTVNVYVRVDENKLYYVLEDGETGDVDIWD